MGFSGGGGTGVVQPAVNVYEKLDNHVTAAGGEASYTFTPVAPLSFDTYSKFIVEIDGEGTATGILEAVLNGNVGVLNYSWGERHTVGVIAAISRVAAASLQLGSASILVINQGVAGTFEIKCSQINALNNLSGSSKMVNQLNVVSESHDHIVITTIDQISSIKIGVTVGLLKEFSRITIYGVKRTP